MVGLTFFLCVRKAMPKKYLYFNKRFMSVETEQLRAQYFVFMVISLCKILHPYVHLYLKRDTGMSSLYASHVTKVDHWFLNMEKVD